MSDFIFSVRKLRKSYNQKPVLDGITLAFLHGAKIGVIGRNGSGKSTLLRIMAGVDKDFEGEAWSKEGIKVGYVPQEPELDPSLDVKGNVMLGVADTVALLQEFDALNERMATDFDAMDEIMAKLEKVQDQIEAKGAWELERKVEQAMHALATPPGDADVSKLSGGEKRRVALCKTLLAEPDLLLLDEPTNHLDADTVHWLERHLAAYKGTVIAITHDRYFLDNVAGWMLELDGGKAFPYEGNYSTFLGQKASRLRDDEKQEAARKRRLNRELEWIRTSPKGRQAKNRARIGRFEDLQAQVSDEREGSISLTIPVGNRLGQDVLKVNGLSKAYEKPLFTDLSFEVPPGAFVGILGPNGAGKTTLFRMIVGQETPDSGSLDLGKTVELCYVDQSRADLDNEKSVYEEISEGNDEVVLGPRRMNARAYVSLFNFRGADQQQLVGKLSGGQRNRVQLAKTLKSGGNVLLLDEPTNDLDLSTMQVLEEALETFPGCVFVISHDRFFLDRQATHVLHLDGEGNAHFFEGGYTAYRQRMLEQGIDIEKTGGTHRRLS
ncbi:MAG: energy-dependent translational throttle protein EttA [Planctomycetes bacterium]|nr:energy-dependent translational throttle protein EttA [Planctomycetota bacterium]